MLSTKEIQKWGIFGAIIGVFTPFVLQLIGKLPFVEVQMATIRIEVQETISGLPTGVAEWFLNLIGGTLPIGGYLLIALGGAIMTIVGALVLDALKQLKGTPQMKVAKVLFVASVVTGWLIAGSIGIPPIMVILALMINALLLGFIWVWIDKQVKFGIVP